MHRDRYLRAVGAFAAFTAGVILCLASAWASTAPAASSPSLAADAKADPELRSAITVNPISTLVGLALGVGSVRLEYHFALTDTFGITLAPEVAIGSIDGARVFGLGAQVGPRFLLTGKRLLGWYLFPNVEVFRIAGGSRTLATVIPALEIGKSYTWKSGFMITAGIGIRSFAALDRKDLPKLLRDIPGAVFPYLNLSFGYGW